jgi:hypothetical protein
MGLAIIVGLAITFTLGWRPFLGASLPLADCEQV